eukprot:3398274-Alexandrium_andersonii.AAC.1
MRQKAQRAPPGYQHPDRIDGAMRAKTRVPGQADDYKLADLVVFHRSGGSKDASGWKGPAK